MINWKFEVKDVCLVDDMKTAECSRSFDYRGWIEGKRIWSWDVFDRAPRCKAVQGCEDHEAHDTVTDAGDLV